MCPTPSKTRKSRQATRAFFLAGIHPKESFFSEQLPSDLALIDWPWLLERAANHKLAALFLSRVKQVKLQLSLPKEIQAQIELLSQAAVQRAFEAGETLRETAALFDEHNIPFFILKGSILAEKAYENPALRPFHDIDIVIRPDDLDQIDSVVTEAGYKFYADLLHRKDLKITEQTAKAYMKRFNRHFNFVPDVRKDRLPLEIHWHVTNPGVLTAEPADFWEETMDEEIAGCTVKTFNPEAFLVHVAVHAVEDGLKPTFLGGRVKFKLLALCDVAWLLEKYGKTYDFKKVWRLAIRWGADSHLIRALQAVSWVLGYPTGILPTRLCSSVFKTAYPFVQEGSHTKSPGRPIHTQKPYSQIYQDGIPPNALGNLPCCVRLNTPWIPARRE